MFTCYMSFHLKTQQINSITWNALLWIVLLFVAINAISKSFIGENQARSFYYFFVVKPTAYLFSKIIYNSLLMLFLAGTTTLFMFAVLAVSIPDLGLFVVNLLLGAIGFSCTLTLIAAVAAKANNPMLMALLSFPVIIPMLLMLIKISNQATDGLGWTVANESLMGLVAINLIVCTASYILFPYLWKS